MEVSPWLIYKEKDYGLAGALDLIAGDRDAASTRKSVYLKLFLTHVLGASRKICM